MSDASLITSYRHADVDGLEVENDHFRLTLFPDAGAKILTLVHKASGRDLLWQNPRVPLRQTYPGVAFDDVWCGGWDELFPTDPACELDGNSFHDHGDLWYGPWDYTLERDDGSEATLHLRRYAVALPCLMEKWITVRRREPSVEFRHRLTNLGTQPVPFTWSLHLAHRISPASRIHLPTDALAAVPQQAGRFGDTAARVGWPDHDGIDMGAVPAAESGLTEWLYALDLREGWCAVTHPDIGVGLGLAFDSSVFKTVWLWGVYGGWRGHYVLLTEPSSSPPGGLATNVGNGTATWLAPGEHLETGVTATMLTVTASHPANQRPEDL
jgi:hypothetical protein